jgi:hypothetical protein
MALLASVIDKYPYFQSARALQLKGLKNESSFLYNDSLKITAAHTTDRDILFEYITSEHFVQNDISQAILQHDVSLNDMEVVAENVSETISIELNRQIKAELSKAEAILDPKLFERKISSVSDLIGHESYTEEGISEDKKSFETKEVSVEKPIETDEPLEFRKDDTHSFREWLQLTKTKPINRDADEQEGEAALKIQAQDEKDRKFELIEKFIQKKPKISNKKSSRDPDSKIPENKNLAAQYTQTPEALMTETLAKVYLQQKNYSKAIQAYKILILKYPEKSGFFADQIRAIKKLINTEEQ